MSDGPPATDHRPPTKDGWRPTERRMRQSRSVWKGPVRRLLYIPIIHSEADLGSVGATLEQRSAALAGAPQWAVHQETVRRFWESVAVPLHELDPRRLRIYQDGLPVGGEVGRRIVAEAARRGSPNYRLVLELLERGAALRQTEDAALLLRERDQVLRAAQPGEARMAGGAATRYRAERERLLAERDAFIAQTIAGTLQEGELGVLFIGAEHDVGSRLPRDIAVEVLKDPAQVRAYVAALFTGADARALAQLGEELAAPVSLSDDRRPTTDDRGA